MYIKYIRHSIKNKSRAMYISLLLVLMMKFILIVEHGQVNSCIKVVGNMKDKIRGPPVINAFTQFSFNLRYVKNKEENEFLCNDAYGYGFCNASM